MIRSPLAFAVLASLLAACDAPQPAVQSSGAPPVAPPTTRAQAAAPAAHAPAAPPAPAPSRPGAEAIESWNEGQIDWQTYEAGLARAQAQHKPIALVLYADWCPHCRNYSHVFSDPRVVARARDMVMVHLNVDQAPDVANRYQLDGTYVPRTYMLASDGTPLADIDAQRPRFKYFYDEHNADSVLAAMDAAVRRR